VAVGDHSSIAIAQSLLGGKEISRPAYRTFELGPPKVTYNWRFSINSHRLNIIEPTGHTFQNDVSLLFLRLEKPVFQHL